MAKRVVIDTNIWISAFIIDGLQRTLIALMKDKVVPIFSEETFNELKEVIFRDDFKGIREEKDKFLNKVRKESVFISETIEHHIMDNIHKNDDIITDCAINGNADFIISGDRHLLNLKKINYKEKYIKILKAKEFLELLETFNL